MPLLFLRYAYVSGASSLRSPADAQRVRECGPVLGSHVLDRGAGLAWGARVEGAGQGRGAGRTLLLDRCAVKEHVKDVVAPVPRGQAHDARLEQHTPLPEQLGSVASTQTHAHDA